MAEGRSRAEWSHTSSVLALIANTNRDKKRKPTPFVPADFDPWSKNRDVRIPTKGVKVLKQVFVDSRKFDSGSRRKGGDR